MFNNSFKNYSKNISLQDAYILNAENDRLRPEGITLPAIQNIFCDALENISTVLICKLLHTLDKVTK